MSGPDGADVYDGAFVRPASWLLAHRVHPNHLTFLQLPVFALQIVNSLVVQTLIHG